MSTQLVRPHTLVIGGTKGIGLSLVDHLNNHQHVVSVIGRHVPEGLKDKTSRSIWMADITQRKKTAKTLTAITKSRGAINNLIFCQRYRGKSSEWAAEMETMLNSTKFIIDDVVSNHLSPEGGSIVVLSSVASSFIASECSAAYHASKAGLNQLVRYYAATLGHKNIRVNCVSPGLVQKKEAETFYRRNKRLHQLYKNVIPLKRLGSSFDISQLIEFLCSQGATYITGQNLIIDGGLSLLWQGSLAYKVGL